MKLDKLLITEPNNDSLILTSTHHVVTYLQQIKPIVLKISYKIKL